MLELENPIELPERLSTFIMTKEELDIFNKQPLNEKIEFNNDNFSFFVELRLLLNKYGFGLFDIQTGLNELEIMYIGSGKDIGDRFNCIKNSSYIVILNIVRNGFLNTIVLKTKG